MCESNAVRILTVPGDELLSEARQGFRICGRFDLVIQLVRITIEIVQFTSAIVVARVLEMRRAQHSGTIPARSSLSCKDGPVRLPLTFLPPLNQRLPWNC